MQPCMRHRVPPPVGVDNPLQLDEKSDGPGPGPVARRANP